MGGSEDEHIAGREPHFQSRRAEPDPSEEKVRRQLEHEAARDRAPYRPGESVYDEPDILPGRDHQPIEQEWRCSECGYNLQGLPAGHPCAECGHRELYRPPPPGVNSYYTWVRSHLAKTSAGTGWAVAVAAALAGGLWAVLASLIGQATQGGGAGVLLLLVVFGPAIEETMKIAVAAYVVELRPYLFRRIEQLQLATIGSAAVFAVIENMMYLYVYFPNHTREYALFRWTVCVALHVVCTLVACRALFGPWREALSEGRQPRITRQSRWILAAIVLHGIYNGSVFLYESFGTPLR
ncbi:MAG: PrsW family intramembrane metalloprotease [bacterium]|nr:PrsW family intramembrane metalloprotease [bacterium]